MNLKNKATHFWHNPDMRTRKVNRSIVYSMAIKGGGILLTLALVPLTLSYLSAYEYGIWITIYSILTWINYFDIGLGNGLRNKLAEALAIGDYKLGQVYVSTTLFLLVIISALFYGIFLVADNFIDWYSLFNVDDSVTNLRTIVNIVMGCLFVNFSLRTIGMIYMAYQNAWANNLMVFLGAVVSFVWIFVLTKTTSGSLINVAVAFSVSPLLVYLLAYPIAFGRYFKEIRPRLSAIRMRYAKDLGGLGVKFFFLQLATLIISSSSNLIISKVFSPAEVTPYSIAFRYFNVLAMVYMIIINPLWTAITDAYVRKDVNWIEANMRKMVYVWLLFTVISIFMVAVSQIVFRLWVGAEVVIPYNLCISIAVYNSTLLWFNLFGCYCNGVGRLKVALWVVSIAAIVFVPCALLMSDWIGVSGVAYAMALVSLIPGLVLSGQYVLDMRQLKQKIAAEN